MVTASASSDNYRAWREVFPAFLRLGLTSFGGPVAHLGFFRQEFVDKRRWLDESTYADIVALCQFLPGPGSSETAMTLGLLRAGLVGAFAAWLGFALPSALAMMLTAYCVAEFRTVAESNVLHGLKVVAVAVVARAVIGMARTLCPDAPRAMLALGATLLAAFAPTTLGQIAAMAAGAVIGWLFLTGAAREGGEMRLRLGEPWPATGLIMFFVLLIGLPVAAFASGNHTLALIDGFYRSGALVFGGGHVVLPVLQAAVVSPGWVSNDAFLAGYGVAQALPGPLFTFAAYLGVTMADRPNGWLGGLIGLLAIFLPGFLLVVGVMPLWSRLKGRAAAQSALAGVNAAVVGLLLAALYNPVWTSAILVPLDLVIALVGFVLLLLRVPQWAVVAMGAAAGAVLL
jgi:chromate transporter